MAAHFINSGNDNDDADHGFSMDGGLFGPNTVDNEIRQAISMCWMVLPEDKKTVDNVETEIRRLVERALKDFREDSQSFGFGS